MGKHKRVCRNCKRHNCVGRHNPKDCFNNGGYTKPKKLMYEDSEPEEDSELVEFSKYNCSLHNYEILNQLYCDHLQHIEQRALKPWEKMGISFEEWWNSKPNWRIPENESWLKENVYTAWELRNLHEDESHLNIYYPHHSLTWYERLINMN